MSQGDHNMINDLSHAEKQLPYIIKRIKEWDYSSPLCFKLSPYRSPRTISQNALFHKWCQQMSDHFIGKVPTATKDNMKLMLKNRFLGMEKVKVIKSINKGGKGGTVGLISTLKRTRDLDVGEMVHFMDCCYSWAIENEVMLSIPRESEYQQLKTKQVT